MLNAHSRFERARLPNLPLISPLPMRIVLLFCLFAMSLSTYASRVLIPRPEGSEEFGITADVLPNGNLIVVDPGFDGAGPLVNIGAIYVYRPDGTLLSRLTGSSAGDRVGSTIIRLQGNSFLVLSPFWGSQGNYGAGIGAVTLIDGDVGLNGTVSWANSLTGNQAGDEIGSGGSVKLPNGNILLKSPTWRSGAAEAGAVTFLSADMTALVGRVSAENSLVGSQNGDLYDSRITVLLDGDFVVTSSTWDSGATHDVGAVTWGSGTHGIRGEVGPTLSLVGSSTGDFGNTTITSLFDGDYLVRSRNWTHGTLERVGAVTVASGDGSTVGVVNTNNSLIGAVQSGQLGSQLAFSVNGFFVVLGAIEQTAGQDPIQAAAFFGPGRTPKGVLSSANALVLGQGNVVSNLSIQVSSSGSAALMMPANGGALLVMPDPSQWHGTIPQHLLLSGANHGDFSAARMRLMDGNRLWISTPFWDRGAIIDAGAFAILDLGLPPPPEFSVANSILGSTSGDSVGSGGVWEHAGSLYVASPLWDRGLAENAGALTPLPNSLPVVGPVSEMNSLVGTSANDAVGTNPPINLGDGRIALGTRTWTNGGAARAGAVTIIDPDQALIGPITASNSLVGSSVDDQISTVRSLGNGDLVVISPDWDRGSVTNAGAVTLIRGPTGLTGHINESNSYVGSHIGDGLGLFVHPLVTGDFLIAAPRRTISGQTSAGSVTHGSLQNGIVGEFDPLRSLWGSQANDQVGSQIFSLASGNALVGSSNWANGSVTRAGAITFYPASGSVSGPVGVHNSIVGNSQNDWLSTENITRLSGDRFVARFDFWDNGTAANVGALLLGLSDPNATGPLSEEIAELGSATSGVSQWVYDSFRNQLVVARGSDGIVLFRPGLATVSAIQQPNEDFTLLGAPIQVITTVSSTAALPSGEGQVRVQDSSGAVCTDTEGEPQPGGSLRFECGLTPIRAGQIDITSEFVASDRFSYSRAPSVQREVREFSMFADGFEAP